MSPLAPAGAGGAGGIVPLPPPPPPPPTAAAAAAARALAAAALAAARALAAAAVLTPAPARAYGKRVYPIRNGVLTYYVVHRNVPMPGVPLSSTRGPLRWPWGEDQSTHWTCTAHNAKARELHWKPLSGPRPTMMLGISRYERRLSARHWVWRCRYSPPSPAATNARPPCAAARSTGWTFTATTRRHAQHTPAQPKRMTGPLEF